MYRSILVPLDISALSEQALPVALGIARRAGAALQLAYVVHQYSQASEEVEAQARTYLEACAARLHDAGWPATVALLHARANMHDSVELVAHDRLIAAALHDHARASGTDLVVMTSHSRGEMARLWLGSVADRLVRELPVPILLIRPQQQAPELSDDRTFNHVLIPVDGSPQSEAVLDNALTLIGLMRARCTVLQAIDPLLAGHTVPPYAKGLSKQEVEQLQQDTRAYLVRIAESIRTQSPYVQIKVVVGEPAEAIVGYAQEHAVDLIAMATHGRRLLSQMVLGSTAARVVHDARAHILLYRPA